MDDELTGVKWKDKCPVAVISTIRGSSIATINRRSKHEEGAWKIIQSRHDRRV